MTTRESEKMEQMLDEVEAEMAEELRAVARDHRDLYKDLIRDVETTDPDAYERARQDIQAEIKPRYREIVEQHYQEIYERAQTITREENEWIDEAMSRQMADNLDNSIEIKLSNLIDEIYQRQDGSLAEQSAEQAQQSPDGTPKSGSRQLEIFEESTFENMSQKTSGSAMAQARHDAIASEADRTNGRMMAVRSAVMDSNTCESCKRLNGERYVVGSSEYWDKMPPSRCYGGQRCRCWYEYEEPSKQRTLPLSDADSDSPPYVKILSWGPVSHPSGDFVVTEEMAQALVDSFEYCKRYGTGDSGLPPIQREHKSDGKTYGTVRDLEVRDDGVYAQLDFKEAVLPAVRAGLIDRVSPHVDPQSEHQHTGETLDWRLLEVSFVSRQHLQNIENLASYEFSDATLEENDMAENEEQEEQVEAESDESTEMADEEYAMADLAGMLQEMGKRIARIEKVVMPDEEEGDAEEGDSEESTENDDDSKENSDDESKKMSDLREENKRLRKRVAQSQVQADMADYDLDDDSRERLTSLAMSDSDLYEDTISLIQQNRDSSESISLSDSEVGSTGSPSTGSSVEAVVREAKNEGVEMGVELVEYCDSRGVDVDLDTAEKIYN